MAEDLDYMAVASMTDGMVGAELANIVEIAAINMMRDGRTEVRSIFLIRISTILIFFFFWMGLVSNVRIVYHMVIWCV